MRPAGVVLAGRQNINDDGVDPLADELGDLSREAATASGRSLLRFETSSRIATARRPCEARITSRRLGVTCGARSVTRRSVRGSATAAAPLAAGPAVAAREYSVTSGE